jgi:hypothetical protein
VVEVPRRTALRRAQGVPSLSRHETGEAPAWQGGRPSISGIFEGGATPPGGMHRPLNAAALSPRAAMGDTRWRRAVGGRRLNPKKCAVDNCGGAKDEACETVPCRVSSSRSDTRVAWSRHDARTTSFHVVRALLHCRQPNLQAFLHEGSWWVLRPSPGRESGASQVRRPSHAVIPAESPGASPEVLNQRRSLAVDSLQLPRTREKMRSSGQRSSKTTRYNSARPCLSFGQIEAKLNLAPPDVRWRVRAARLLDRFLGLAVCVSERAASPCGGLAFDQPVLELPGTQAPRLALGLGLRPCDRHSSSSTAACRVLPARADAWRNVR